MRAPLKNSLSSLGFARWSPTSIKSLQDRYHTVGLMCFVQAEETIAFLLGFARCSPASMISLQDEYHTVGLRCFVQAREI